MAWEVRTSPSKPKPHLELPHHRTTGPSSARCLDFGSKPGGGRGEPTWAERVKGIATSSELPPQNGVEKREEKEMGNWKTVTRDRKRAVQPRSLSAARCSEVRSDEKGCGEVGKRLKVEEEKVQRPDVEEQVERLEMEKHRDVGRSEMEKDKDVGRSEMEKHKDVGRSEMEKHKDVGRSEMEKDKDVGRSEMEKHKDVGRSEMEKHKDVGRSEMEEEGVPRTSETEKGDGKEEVQTRAEGQETGDAKVHSHHHGSERSLLTGECILFSFCSS